MDSLDAITALDGRYRSKVEPLAEFFSEAALIRARIQVELYWLSALLECDAFTSVAKKYPDVHDWLQTLLKESQTMDVSAVKETERTTNHDVKAVEYVLRTRLSDLGAGDDLLALIHWGCTSEDINNCAWHLLLERARGQMLLAKMDTIITAMDQLANDYSGLAMLSRTHGQNASPTTLGKEMAVFSWRLKKQRRRFAHVELPCKMSGAVGNYNAHVVAYPDTDWVSVARDFMQTKLGLRQNPMTTQIENHDGIVEYTQALSHFNSILIGLSQDIWAYISRGYFKLRTIEGEVGSSTMPHKVNPIDFENSEGNLGIANSLGQYFMTKLPISRWQRDLSDSTTLRNLGSMAGHSFLAWVSLEKGLKKLAPNESVISQELNDATEVLTEAVQTVLRGNGVSNAYELAKAASRGKSMDRSGYESFVKGLSELSPDQRDALLKLTPQSYVGLAEKLTMSYLNGKFEGQ